MGLLLQRLYGGQVASDPFIIFTLPRSRSAWLSHWLSYIKDGHRVKAVGHDAFSRCSSVEQCKALFEDRPERPILNGTVETGAAFAYRLISVELPKAKLLVVQREPMECLRSLLKQGVRMDVEDWGQRVKDLWTVSASGVRTIAYSDLELESCARWIWEYCLDAPWDGQWWAQWAPTNVQIDMRTRIEELKRNEGNVKMLKEECRRLMEGTSSYA